MVSISVATPNDAAAIVGVIREAFALEAARYGVAHLPPMLETAEELIAAMHDHVVLKAVEGERVVGTVRGRVEAGVCEIGRLAVDPACLGRGIGQALMRAVESACDAERFVLFTGSKSDGPLHIYRKLGYLETHREPGPGQFHLIHMEKTAEA